jgi:hypothetical protein
MQIGWPIRLQVKAETRMREDPFGQNINKPHVTVTFRPPPHNYKQPLQVTRGALFGPRRLGLSIIGNCDPMKISITQSYKSKYLLYVVFYAGNFGHLNSYDKR